MTLKETLVQMEYLRLGLIPPGMSVSKALSSMKPEDSRKARRKFRKQHRKAKSKMKNHAKSRLSKKGYKKDSTFWRLPDTTRPRRENIYENRCMTIDNSFGHYSDPPSPSQKKYRKNAVRGMISEDCE